MGNVFFLIKKAIWSDLDFITILDEAWKIDLKLARLDMDKLLKLPKKEIMVAWIRQQWWVESEEIGDFFRM